VVTLVGILACEATAVGDTAMQCDGPNCWWHHDGGVLPWTIHQRAAATPASLAKLSPANASAFHEPPRSPPPAPCPAPAKQNATACGSNGLPCASMGKLYLIQRGEAVSCSGTFIAPHWVLTAGHCCKDPDPSTGLKFFLDYNDGASSGSWIPSEVHVPQEWATSRDRPHDWCFLKMSTPGPKHIAPVSSTFDPSQVTFNAYGYPMELPYDGKFMYEAIGSCRGTTKKCGGQGYGPCKALAGAAGMLYMSCNTMTPGCSGGAWEDPARGVFGLNSAYIMAPDQPWVYASPYFGDDFHASCAQVGACDAR
jgi:hypothetical protein